MDQPKPRSAQQARHKRIRFAFGAASAPAWFNIVHPVVTLLGHRVGGTGKLVLPVGLG